MASPPLFSYPNLVIRWAAALFLVFATYNPSGNSYYHWLVDPDDGRWSLKALVGLTLAIAHLTFVFATLRAIGVTGMLTTAALFATVVWALMDHGYLLSIGFWTWVTIILGLVGSLLAVGVSWSHIRARLAGQIDSNDVTL
ncbi:MAG: DUF6524 family protein [Magnetospirillum sp. WYHS-4]